MIFLAALPVPEVMDFWKFIVSAWAIYSIYAKWQETEANKRIAKSGTRDEPFNIAQPLSVQQAIVHAEKTELDKLKDAVTTLTRSVDTNHTTLLLNGSERATAIKEALRKEVGEVMREVSSFKDSMHEALGDVRERIASAETRLDELQK